MTELYIPDRGDIIWVNLNPRSGHEQSGKRPALVLSPRLFSTRTGLAVICPVTSKVKGLPFEVVLSDTKTQGAVLPIHVRSVDIKVRHFKYIERCPPKLTSKVTQMVATIIHAEKS